MLLNVIILLAGVFSSLVGAAFDNQALTVFSAILVCTPLIQKSIDQLLRKKWLDAIPTCSGLLALIAILIWALNLDPFHLELSPDIPVLSFTVFGAGIIQLLWMLLIVQE